MINIRKDNTFAYHRIEYLAINIFLQQLTKITIKQVMSF